MSASKPVQKRSKKTMEDILSAAEKLLESKEFDDISVAEIIARAGCTTGSFYARFEGKDALLPSLYERYNHSLADAFASVSAGGDALTLADQVRRPIAVITEIFVQRPNLMRAVVHYARKQKIGDAPADQQQRRALASRIVETFEPFHDDISHPHPARALELGLFTAIASLREYFLFPSAPNAAALGLDADQFREEVAAMVFAYLQYSEGNKK